MAYIPKNLQIFTAAFAGALAGMGLSDRVISDTNALNYAGLATVAGAWAQAIDTAWTLARGATLLDVETVQSVSAAYWQNRSPNADTSNTNPATFAAPALAVLAPITAGESYYASQGITPPAIPGGFPAGGGNFAADIVTLGTIPTGALNNGLTYYVGTVQVPWILNAQSTAVIDGITVIAAQASGRWLRNLSFVNPNWLQVNNWWIDATNGNDENDGQAAVSAANHVGPLKTYGELARRWSGGIIRPTQVSGSNLLCVVTFLTSLPNSDPVYSACELGSTVVLRFQGQPETILFQGSFTSVTARSPSTNAATVLGDTTLTPTTFLNKRWRNTTVGARNGQVGFIAKDLGGNTFRSSTPMIPTTNSPTDPQVGDTYNIETLTTVSMGDMNYFTIQAGATAGGPFFEMRDMACRLSGFTSLNWIMQGGNSNLALRGCDFQTGCNFFMGVIGRAFACQFQAGLNAFCGEIGFSACLVAGATGIVNFTGGAVIELENGTMCQACNIKGTNYQIIDACVFDCPNNTSNNAGNGITIGKTYSAALLNPHSIKGWASMDTRLWGNGNAGVGVYVGAGSSFNYAVGTIAGITITGALGDFSVNQLTSANVWDPTASAGAGAFLAPRTCTWAHLAATVAGGGFNGFAQDVLSGAKIVAAASY